MPNALAGSRSLYLRQHQDNPVDWELWCDAAFERAAREGKPVFLSIGYSACHWCHVMAHESFEDDETAALLNEHFVCIKVDREERPDIDTVYQRAYQALMQRSGGWPLSMFLLPSREPFFGGTYFPKAAHARLPTFTEVIRKVLSAWSTQRPDLVTQAQELARMIVEPSSAPSDSSPNAVVVLAHAARSLLARADRENGGFGRAPKFPALPTLTLLAHTAVAQSPLAAPSCAHLLRTLDRMSRGGMFDQLAGGFARYSTDAQWLVPHFEKMLSDNGQHLTAYALGLQILASETADHSHVERFNQVLVMTARYLVEELCDPRTGAFYTSQDADTEGAEGAYFLWTPEEIRDATPTQFTLAEAHYSVASTGSFDSERSVLAAPHLLSETAHWMGISLADAREGLEIARADMLRARRLRPAPATNTQCVCASNALAISGLALASVVRQSSVNLQAAVRALDALCELAWDPVTQRLAHGLDGLEPYGEGFLDDYAALGLAALHVYRLTGETRHLTFARSLAECVLSAFYDSSDRCFYYTARHAEVVLARTCELFDQSTPSATALAIELLLSVHSLCEIPAMSQAAEVQLRAVSALCAQSPMGVSALVQMADRLVQGDVELVILGDRALDETQAMVRAAQGVFVPHRVDALADDSAHARAQGLAPRWWSARGRDDGSPVAYVCIDGACLEPATNADSLGKLLLIARDVRAERFASTER
ncbi:MAG: thioredoxin domain-containing protein [Deltaproteobacteria bacterium]|nr:thioredoxin domain-containing protein [Deltaproteobacteria bacterium]